MDELCQKINEALGSEVPLVVALALLTAIRVHEQLVNGILNRRSISSLCPISASG
jgi:hypothetical protein